MFQFGMRLCTLSLLFISGNARSAPEPLCSKFSYDEQLLEKMVRVEFNVNNMEKNMLETETRIKETQQKMEETRTELMGTKESMQSTLEEIKQKLTSLELIEAKLGMLGNMKGNDAVAFHAHKIADKSVTNKQVFVFTEVLLNEGSGYSSTDGYFTAPVSGIYFFNCHLCGKNGKNVNYIIVVDGKTHASGLYKANAEGTCSSFSATVHMRSAEKAWVTIDSNGSSSADLLYEDSDDWNYFSGFLVRQTP